MKPEDAAQMIHATASRLEFPTGRVNQAFLDSLADELREVAREIVHGNRNEFEAARAASSMGAKGGSSRSPRKVASSRSNIVGWHRRQGHRLTASETIKEPRQ